jgi:hypothetical protein
MLRTSLTAISRLYAQPKHEFGAIPSEQEYLFMTRRKTGTYLASRTVEELRQVTGWWLPMMNVFQGAGSYAKITRRHMCWARPWAWDWLGTLSSSTVTPCVLLGVIQHSQLVKLAAALSKTNDLT